MDDNSQINEKWAIFDENASTIAHQTNEKYAIFGENTSPIAHQNNEKMRGF